MVGGLLGGDVSGADEGVDQGVVLAAVAYPDAGTYLVNPAVADVGDGGASGMEHHERHRGGHSVALPVVGDVDGLIPPGEGYGEVGLGERAVEWDAVDILPDGVGGDPARHLTLGLATYSVAYQIAALAVGRGDAVGVGVAGVLLVLAMAKAAERVGAL